MSLWMPVVHMDCDGPLADFIEGALRVVHDVTGRRYSPEEVTRFDFCEALGLSSIEARAVKDAIRAKRGFVLNLRPQPGAIDGMRRLRGLAELHVVTSPWPDHETWAHEREAWLRRHFNIGHSRVHHSSAKYLFNGDVLVDDKIEHVLAWKSAYPKGLAVLWRTPQNATEQPPYGGRVTSSWDELVSWVKELRPRDSQISMWQAHEASR